MECPGEGEEWGDDGRAAREWRVSMLALRYRSGDPGALGELYEALRGAIVAAIRPHATEPWRLPAGVETEDLYQQAYVELAELVRDWDPNRRANFVPYFLRSFPWRIDHYLRSQSSARRTALHRVVSTPHDLLMERIERSGDQDGRDWDDAIASGEMLRRLPERCRRVVQLHLIQGLPFVEVARIMGIGRSTAHDAYKRAMMLLRRMAEPSAES